MSLPKILLAVAVSVVVSPFAARQLRADVILSNLPGTGSYTGTTILTASAWEAVGLQTGSSPETFTDLQGYFHGGTAGGDISGGIYLDNGGKPASSASVLFDNVSVPPLTQVMETITTQSPFMLAANTEYWFVLHDPSVPFTWQNDTSNGSNGAAPTAYEGGTYEGYEFTGNTGSTWSAGGLHPTITVDASPTAVPEPASLALIGLPAAMALLRRRRKLD